MESNMICITEEQASKLEALGVTVAISYTVDAALMAALADILSINSMEEKVVRTQTRRKPKYAKRRKDNKERFTFLHASHSLDKSAEATFPLAFMVDGKAPAVCQRAQMNLFRQMRRTGLRVLSRDGLLQHTESNDGRCVRPRRTEAWFPVRSPLFSNKKQRFRSAMGQRWTVFHSHR